MDEVLRMDEMISRGQLKHAEYTARFVAAAKEGLAAVDAGEVISDEEFDRLLVERYGVDDDG